MFAFLETQEHSRQLRFLERTVELKQKTLQILGYTLAFFLLASEAAVAERFLNKAACDFIEAYPERNGGVSFEETVAHMGHDIEFCEQGDQCSPVLRKRSTDKVLFTLDSGSSSAHRNILFEQIVYVGNSLSEWSEKSFVTQTETLDDTGVIHIVVTEDEDVAAYDTNAPEALDRFLKSDRQFCIAVNFDWAAADIEYSEVYVKSHLSPVVFAQCLREEIYNASGVPGDPPGYDSLFHKSSEDFRLQPTVIDYSEREELVMRIIYSEQLKNRQSIDETRHQVRSILENACAPH